MLKKVFPPVFCYVVAGMLVVSFLVAYLMVRFDKDLNHWYRNKGKFPLRIFLEAAFVPALQILPIMIGIRIGAVLA